MKTRILNTATLVGLIFLIQPQVVFGQCTSMIGDINEDGAVDLLDVDPFINFGIGGAYLCSADINQDGTVDLLDVAPFIELLIGSEISPIGPDSIDAEFTFVPNLFGGTDNFQFAIRFDNHEPNSITSVNAIYVRTFVRVRNTLTQETIEGSVITYDIDVVEDKLAQESVGLIDARTVVDWVFLTPEDFGPEGDYVVDFVRFDLELPSFKDVDGNNIVGTVERQGF